MSMVSYNTCCCNCTKLNGTRGHIIVNGSIEEYLKMTEYQFSFILNEWMNDIEAYCHFCGSKNVYAENIEIDDKRLYTFDLITIKLNREVESNNFLIFNLLKTSGNVNREIGGKNRNEGDFVLDSWAEVVGAISKIPEDRFIENDNGQFFIALTGGNNGIKIQSLKMCGFNKRDILKHVSDFFTKLNFF